MSNLANTYRPLIFQDLIGQDVMVRTLRNSITLGRLANAFLLTGSYGIGKTTTARIIAKSLNCSDNSSPDPCMKCVHCIDITKSVHIDVLEMDAASHTSVDDIRTILENAQYIPLQSKFKIYIIDEVHMLSKSAFNALLKALEEPYPHVKFILATTELHKVPATIISRCQRFHLQRINNKQLENHIIKIAKQESCKITEESATLIAQVADGSARDAISILEQAISYSDDMITIEHVQNILGISNKIKIQEMLMCIADKQPANLLKTFEELYNGGGDPLLILNDILEQFNEISKMHVIPFENEKLKALSQKFSLELLNRLWQALFNGIQTVKLALNIYTASEMILLRLCYLSSLPSPSEAIKELNNQTELSANKILDLCRQNHETTLLNYLTNNLQIINISDNIITLNMIISVNSLSEVKNRLITCLKTWTQKDWGLEIIDKSADNPMISSLMQEFDGAKLTNIKKL